LAEGERRIGKVRYVLSGEVAEKTEEAAQAKEASGCFVLLTNVPAEGDMAH